MTEAGTPVPRSQVGAAFEQPLSSGLSIADVTEQAPLSVVRVVTGSGAGTGFVVNEAGLVVTNKHVVGAHDEVSAEFASGDRYRGTVTHLHPGLDLAYIQLKGPDSFAPIPLGDSNEIRVGEEVIVIGFPLSRSLGLEPTVSIGIISAKREDGLQTDAALNPGNSGGPLLDIYGNAAGVVVSRVESDASGRQIAGIGFAIPINEVKASMERAGHRASGGIPSPAATAFPTIRPTPDLGATKTAIATVDAYRRQVELATRTASEAKQEAERYAALLEATRIAELPTPTPEPTPTPAPTPTPHPSTFCPGWEALVLEWVKQGNIYVPWDHAPYDGPWDFAEPPDHPELPAKEARGHCLTHFSSGILFWYGGGGWNITSPIKVGHGRGELLPGTYEYRQRSGDKRVERHGCKLTVNHELGKIGSDIDMAYGEPFTFTFFTYHEVVVLGGHLCEGLLYRTGD